MKSVDLTKRSWLGAESLDDTLDECVTVTDPDDLDGQIRNLEKNHTLGNYLDVRLRLR